VEPNDLKNGLPLRDKMFHSRKVFTAYIVCWVITLASALGSIISTLILGETPIEKLVEHLSLCIGAFIALHIPVRMRTKMHVHIPPVIHISIAFMILAHFVLGEVYRFYDHVKHFDKVLHLSGGFIIAICGFSIVRSFSKNEDGSVKLSPFFAAIFSLCFSITLLALWEFFEYAVDSISGINMQRWQDGLLYCINGIFAENTLIDAQCVENARLAKIQFAEVEIDGTRYWLTNSKRGSGLIDTMNDMIIGAIGAAIVSTLGAFWVKKYPDDTKYMIVRKKPTHLHNPVVGEKGEKQG